MVIKPLTKEAWSHVMEKACDIANAVMRDDDVMVEVYTVQMLKLLDEMEEEYGNHTQLLATRADYLENDEERRALFEKALVLAKERGDQAEVDEILDSLRTMEE